LWFIALFLFQGREVRSRPSMAGTIAKARMADGEEGVATEGFIRKSGAL
jgi:hypothetical protein